MFDDVLCFSHLRWGSVHQRPNHLMSRCARRHRVFFVEEPCRDGGPPRLEIQRREHGLHVVVPHVPGGTAEDEAEHMQRELVGRLCREARIQRPLVWIYSPMALPLVERVEAVGCVYDCVDELTPSAGGPPQLAARERELLKLADVVFTGGRSLHDEMRARHRNVFAFPSSVDLAHFEKARGPLPEPADQADVPHPRIGFSGVVDHRLDRELLDAVAASRPDLQLVLLGPVVKIDPASLPRRPNIHWLGRKPYAELPSYIAGWEVAMIPFVRDDTTRFVSPTKALEYLAAGRPVVSTSIGDVVRSYGDANLVRIADEPLAFAAAIDAAIAERGTAAEAAHRDARDRMLARTSWDRTWSRMYALVHEALFKRGCVLEEEGAPCSTT
jgi:UDP-galactopyranose mutase